MFKESNYAVNWGRQFVWVTSPHPRMGGLHLCGGINSPIFSD